MDPSHSLEEIAIKWKFRMLDLNENKVSMMSQYLIPTTYCCILFSCLFLVHRTVIKYSFKGDTKLILSLFSDKHHIIISFEYLFVDWYEFDP